MDSESKKNKSTVFIVLLLIIIVGLSCYIFFGNNHKEDENIQKLDETQSEYVKPEEPVDRSKNVTLPGWGGFTIPANTKEITKGFEFHNPEENYWYEDHVSIDGNELETLVVDSGNKVELEHYLKLANVRSNIKEVKSYDQDCFKIENNEIEAIQGFTGKKKIVVLTSDDKAVTLNVKCKSECYYMTFGLFLSENDEELYQSDLVAPGKYIQSMTMNKALKPGKYDAYVVCQPYRSDKKTKTNQGVVRITLTVQ